MLIYGKRADIMHMTKSYILTKTAGAQHISNLTLTIYEHCMDYSKRD